MNTYIYRLDGEQLKGWSVGMLSKIKQKGSLSNIIFVSSSEIPEKNQMIWTA